MSAGWYSDPGNAAGLRWWDGSAWTNHVAPSVPTWGMPAAPDPQRDLDTELRIGRYARIGILLGPFVYLAYYVVVAIFASKVIHQFRDYVDQIRLHPDGNPNLFSEHQGTFVGVILGVDGFGFLIFAVQVLLLIWLYNAATVAQRLGIPARHTPIWAAVGFFIPIINLWYPYQCMADLFGPGDPNRRVAGWWWACWLLQGLAVIPVFVVAVFSIPAALLVAVVAAVVPFGAARLGAALIKASAETHQAQLAAALTG